MASHANLNEQMQRVEELVQTIESAADPNLRTKAIELVQTLMDFHGAGIDRMMEITAKAGAAGYARALWAGAHGGGDRAGLS